MRYLSSSMKIKTNGNSFSASAFLFFSMFRFCHGMDEMGKVCGLICLSDGPIQIRRRFSRNISIIASTKYLEESLFLGLSIAVNL